MPRLKENEYQRIDREWNALCRSQMILLRIPTTEKLAKRMGCHQATAADRIRSPRYQKLDKLIETCKILHIDFDEVAKIVKGS